VAIELLTPLGFFVATPATVPWREVLPQIPAAEKPGRMLRAARGKEEVTQVELARRTGIPRRYISEMEHGKRPIGKETAKTLGKALNISYRVFL
jgi:plasmid maintenance system antidote protein VapI